MKKCKIVSPILLLIVAMALCFTACKYDATIKSGIDFTTSAFKHITNGGKDSESATPYNINAITGATLTVEGPAVKTSVPLSTKEIENENEGLARGVYKDKSGQFLYEGMDLYYLVNKMQQDGNGIVLTDNAYKVVLKNCNREDVAEFTIDEITRAHKDNQPILIAYGVGSEDGKTVAPFVFDAANEDEHSDGYIDSLKNDDGCLKLVYNFTKYGENKEYKKFSNVAYIYVCEETEPGYLHDESSGKEYDSPDLKNYIVSFSGDALGYEIDMPVKDLEALLNLDKKNKVVPEGLGYSNYYSLANNAYWYVNEYEGLDLYKLLQYLGMDSAEKMGDSAEKTKLTFFAADGYTSSQSFNVAQISDYNNFGFYKKNAIDNNDGTYKSTPKDLVDTGYPVLLSFGVNNYPYVINSEDKGYLSGLANDGGPVRVVFGKTEYNHPNGSNQVKFLSKIVVGKGKMYNTHTNTDNKDYKALAKNKVSINVNDDKGTKITDTEMTIRQIEKIIYDEDVPNTVKAAAQAKSVYENKDGSTDIYEGINLEYLLTEVIGIPGTIGTVTFSNGKDKITVDLDTIFNDGYNTKTGQSGLKPVIAFAKNGTPLVKNSKSAGYVSERKLNVLSDEPSTYKVKNSGGPLQIIIPSSDSKNSNAKYLNNVTSISVNIEPDSYTHTSSNDTSLLSSKIKLYGAGLDLEKTYTVSDIEGMQMSAKTLDFSVLNQKGTLNEVRYRGVTLYDLLSMTGIKYNADKVVVYSSDGTKKEFSLADIRNAEYINYVNKNKDKLTPLIAFGSSSVDKNKKDGLPLALNSNSSGYNKGYYNDGGPLMLVMPQADKKTKNASLCIKDVVAVEVTAKEMTSWGHSSSDVYSNYLDEKFTLVVKNKKSTWEYTWTLKQLEDMTDLVTREDYTILELGPCEGLNLWKLIENTCGNLDGLKNPESVKAFASDGYSQDLLSTFYLEGLQKGVVSNTTGQRRSIILCYAVKGYPLVVDETDEGYSGAAGNAFGPLRIITENTSGTCMKYCNKVVVTIPGTGPIDINYKYSK